MLLEFKLPSEDGTIGLNYKKEIADSWNDLPLDKLIHIYQILQGGVTVDDREANMTEKRILAFQSLTDLPNLDPLPDLDEEERFYLIEEATAFLFDKQDPDDHGSATMHGGDQAAAYSIALTRTTCPIPQLLRPRRNARTIKNRKHPRAKDLLVGPANEFRNISIYELGIVFSKFEQFIRAQQQNPEGSLDIANELIAIIYRPHKPINKYNQERNFEGDRRQPYQGFEHTVARRQEIIARHPSALKQVILFWVASCREHIVNRYPEIFDGKGEADPLGWGGVLLELAGNITDLDKVGAQPYATAFEYIKREDRKAKKRAKNSRNTVGA